MSGGSYNYLFQKVDDAASELEHRSPTPQRRAFAEHLRKVAKALHAVEWVDSSDWSPGDENEPIMDVVSRAEFVAALEEAMAGK
jgi:hypothetical protein